MIVTVDEDVRLSGVVSVRRGNVWWRTGLRSPWMMPIECRYFNPLATSASFISVSASEDRGRKGEIGHTRRRRLTSGCFDVNSMMFPLVIHSVMIHNGNSFGETPSTGKMLGWERRLQITISWNKRCHQSSEACITCEITGCVPA
jgi:hypothetical protein